MSPLCCWQQSPFETEKDNVIGLQTRKILTVPHTIFMMIELNLFIPRVL